MCHQEGSAMPQPKERVSIAEVTSPLASMRERPTFTQAFGARMLNLLLWVICGLGVAFLLAWLSTRPTLAQVQSALGAAADYKAVLETLREMQREHADQFRSFLSSLYSRGSFRSLRCLPGIHLGCAKTHVNQCLKTMSTMF
jgi:hypothetical protein